VLDWAADVRTHTPSQTADVGMAIRIEDRGAHIEQHDPYGRILRDATLPHRRGTPFGGRGAIRAVRALPPRPALRRLAGLDQLQHGIP
jgi:hypothetical protein